MMSCCVLDCSQEEEFESLESSSNAGSHDFVQSNYAPQVPNALSGKMVSTGANIQSPSESRICKSTKLKPRKNPRDIFGGVGIEKGNTLQNIALTTENFVDSATSYKKYTAQLKANLESKSKQTFPFHTLNFHRSPMVIASVVSR
jgi:hypothetical protein